VSRSAVGIDVGGTKCLGVVLGPDGDIRDERRIPTPDDPERLVGALTEMVRDLGAIDEFGIGVPGLVDTRGVLIAAPNVTAATMLPLRELLERSTGLRVVVDNDNTAACLAEWRLGAGRGHDDVTLVGLGTGIGGGFVAGGHLQRGAHGFAGEIGHMIVDRAGRPCPCGQRGCWERYASGSALAVHAREAAGAGRFEGALAAAGSIDAIRGEHVTSAAIAGDPEALAVVATFVEWVGVGLVSLVNLLDPSVVVIAGGLSAHPELFLHPIQREFDSTLFGGAARVRPSITFAQLGPRAGAIGAALLPGVV
jgi:glucokinase